MKAAGIYNKIIGIIGWNRKEQNIAGITQRQIPAGELEPKSADESHGGIHTALVAASAFFFLFNQRHEIEEAVVPSQIL